MEVQGMWEWTEISVLSLAYHTRGCGPGRSEEVVFVLRDTVA